MTTREAALPLTDAPKDHTMLWLMVDYSGDGANPLEDEILGWTIGHNGFDHTGVDEWEFAGWSWEQDCFTQGVGKVVGWYPLQRPDQQPATEPQGYVEGLGLKRIVEEVDGAMRHGTWRDAHGMRLKDTPEWVAFYVALAQIGAKP